MTVTTVDRTALETKVKSMYTDVATNPHGSFHFEMGRAMAERLGYAAADLDRMPQDAIDSFAGVGYFFHLADLKPGEQVVDLGSGSGMDTFVASLKVGPAGRVVGVDMTDAQLAKAERLAAGRRVHEHHVPEGIHRGHGSRIRGLRLRDLQRRDQSRGG